MTEILYLIGGFAVGVLSTILIIKIAFRVAEQQAFREFWMP